MKLKELRNYINGGTYVVLWNGSVLYTGMERDIPDEYNAHTITSIRPRGASDPRYADYLWIGTYKRNDWRGNKDE